MPALANLKGEAMTTLPASRRLRASAVAAVALATGLALAAAGCGSGSDPSSSSASTSGSDPSYARPAAAGAAKKGGTITVLSAGDVDHIDPGQAYYSFSYEITYATQRPLLAYKPNSVNAVPDLAASMPTVSKDGRTVTVHIRKGVRFSPPVNREVTSADVKYAIERGFATSVATGYVQAYFGDLVGAPATAGAKVPSIKGIETPNPTTLVFKLKQPLGVFVGALGMPITAPVPAEYARKYDNKTLSDYGLHQVATGPYMIKANASGNINGVGYQPGKLIELVRNPNWDASTSWRPAYADKILFKEGFQDPTVMTRQILSGSADVNGDTPPTPAELRTIQSNSAQRSQLFFTPTGGSRYIALNTRKAPFDKLAVRQAVAYVLDRNALRLTRGGPIDGRIATHFIDPSFKNKGFVQSGGYGFDPFPSPGFNGNVAKAKALMRQAGYPSGMYTGPQLTMVADNTPPGSNTAQVVAADLAKIGLRVKTISVTHSTMYTRFCNVPKNEPNVCPNVGWLPDFHEPQAILNVTFNGQDITPVNNSNWPLLNVPSLNGAMNRATHTINPAARYAEWGRIDKAVTKTAAAIPWLWEEYPTLFSSKVTPSAELWNGGGPDVTFMSVK
jgi:peptide/nickel transport system substrate-binding protein